MKSQRIDETGNVYGKLTVVGFSHSATVSKTLKPGDRSGSRTLAFWRCKCECGRERVVVGRDLRRKDKRAVRTCGTCPRISHGMSYSSEYISWHMMMSRCTMPAYSGYPQYGGRGITVCDKWLTFSGFIEDMGPKPSQSHTIDRFPNRNGNYEPSNCRWATKADQNRNMETNVWIEHDNEKLVLTDWLKKLGVPVSTYYSRRRRGLPIKKALGL